MKSSTTTSYLSRPPSCVRRASSLSVRAPVTSTLSVSSHISTSGAMEDTVTERAVSGCVSANGRRIIPTQNAVRSTRVERLEESAAPVARTIASLTAGDALLLRDNAPSIIVRSIPKPDKPSIHLLREAVEEGPERITFPSETTFAVISLPRAVVSSDTSTSSDTILRAR